MSRSREQAAIRALRECWRRVGRYGKSRKRKQTGMPMDARDTEQMEKDAIQNAEVKIRDLAGDGDRYAATVISESFRGKSRVQQHQIVYQSLRGQMGGVLHVLALQTGVPEG